MRVCLICETIEHCVDGIVASAHVHVVASHSWNGDQLGGCAIHDSAFASTPPMTTSDIVGMWQGSKDVSTFGTANSVSARIFLTFVFHICIVLVLLVSLPGFLFKSRESFENF
jgi:hypothetical protein